MRYGPIPSTSLERVALWAGKVPIPLMDALFSIMKARGLMAATSLGVFARLAESPGTAEEVSRDLKLDRESLELLLRSLVWAGYLKLKGRVFSLSTLSRTSMVPGSEMDLSGFVKWNYVQWRMVEHLEELLTTGKGVDFHSTMSDPREWATYQEAMLNVAAFDAPVLAKHVPVKPGARKLLDVAGSHGLLGAAICKKHPPMKSTVIDLPAAVEHARELAKQAGILDVVQHRPGDIMTADLGNDNDVALLANIVHHFTPDRNIGLLKRVHQSLTASGSVAVWELESPDTASAPTVGDGAALFFRLTSTARCYSGGEYAGWLRESGFSDVRVRRPALSPGSILVTGRKQTR